MPSKNHVHKYHWRKLGSSSRVLACALPDCSHYQPAHLEAMNEGKKSICNQCAEEFVLTSDALKEDKPRCEDCRFEIVRAEEAPALSPAMQEYLREKG